MELTQPLSHKRPQSLAGIGPSSLARPSNFFTEEGYDQLSVQYQPYFGPESLTYGQTSSFDSSYNSQSEEAPIKRRRFDNSYNTMPQGYPSMPDQGNWDKFPSYNPYEPSTYENQFLLASWAGPAIPNPPCFARFPKRMVELVCGAGGCGFESDQSDVYRDSHVGQAEAYDPNQPYLAEKHPVLAPQVSPQQAATPFNLVDTGPMMYENASAQVNAALSTFTDVSQLHSAAEFPPIDLISSQTPSYPTPFPDSSAGHEHDHVSSPTFGHDSSILYNPQTQVAYGFGNSDVALSPPPIEKAEIGVSLATGPKTVLLTAKSIVEDVSQQPPIKTTGTQAQPPNFNILLPNQRGGKRGPFRDLKLREQTAQTRRSGCCLRCKMQRIRCESNPNEPEGVCLTCKKMSSNKANRFPCLRYRLTDVRLFKPGQVPGYEWTRRWTNNISDPIQKWASPDVKSIRISTGYSNKCIILQVRKFVPQEGDKLERTWVFQGTRRSVNVPPYALTDLEEGKTAYMKHITEAMGDTLQSIAERSSGIMKETYLLAFRIYNDPALPPDWTSLFRWTFTLWTAIRLSTTSDFIVGDEKLGMPNDILDATSPNQGKIPVPPVLGAQLDLVLIHHIQTKLRRELLDKLQREILKNKQSSWLITYLVTFMLLHNASLITAHDAAYARKHGINRRFAREDKVKEYQLGEIRP
ncbi:hypothetical protein QQS21_011810 [Conoideocrella luteorostrata]|uniref:Zn(2)-C6 fungal-type domain-containing protein n=1 Tax=Conoideocrella luteorostrata TaxID=1105319 RepID=A0AAJ0CDG1_9HYPO|nr:hypothetical protein QQS21_011810 [Conoideocrella luteorostrata]